MDEKEFLLKENPRRFVIYPIKYTDIWDMYKKHRNALWIENEVDLVTDLKDWSLLNENEKHFISYVLAFFASSDGIIMENLATRFYKDIQIPEAKCFYSVQLYMEGVHSIMYGQLIETLIKDQNKRNTLFNALENIPVINKKGNWAIKWIDSAKSFATRLVAFAAVEGIFFSGSFCCIYWLNESGRMPGLCKSNDFIARDEGMHTEFACLLYRNYIDNKLTDDEIYEIINEAVEIEIEFITKALPCNLLGMNSEQMIDYIKYVANRLISQLGYNTLYKNIKQPFSFMDRICLETKNNFFESRVTEYQINTDNVEINNISFNSEF